MAVFKGSFQIMEIDLFTQQSSDGKVGDVSSALRKARSHWFKLRNELRLCGDGDCDTVSTPDTAFKKNTGQINGNEHMHTCKLLIPLDWAFSPRF